MGNRIWSSVLAPFAIDFPFSKSSIIHKAQHVLAIFSNKSQMSVFWYFFLFILRKFEASRHSKPKEQMINIIFGLVFPFL